MLPLFTLKVVSACDGSNAETTPVDIDNGHIRTATACHTACRAKIDEHLVSQNSPKDNPVALLLPRRRD